MKAPDFKYVSGSEQHIQHLDKLVLAQDFFRRVQCSFFIIDSSSTPNKDVLSEIIQSLISYNGDVEPDIPDSTILDISTITGVEGSYVFPFLEYEHQVYEHFGLSEAEIEQYLRKFTSKIFPYICIIPIEDKLVIFTDIQEEHIIKYLHKYNVLELYRVIPRVIDAFKNNVPEDEIDIKELGISFPLSMLGNHAHIKNKLKKGTSLGNDTNFTNLIRYGLLDYLKLQTKYTISFNSDSEKNKFRLHGRLYDINKGDINEEIFEHLKLFINDISVSSEDTSINEGLLDLPIYIVSGKYSYANPDYPKFKYDNEKEQLTLRLPEIEEEFLITGIFPQYMKLNREGFFSYLTLNSGSKSEDELDEFNFEEDFFEDDSEKYCHDFLQEVRDKVAKRYSYVSEEEDAKGTHFMVTDFFVSAILGDDRREFLLNFTYPKKERQTEKLKMSVDVYSLSYSNFDWYEITLSIDNFNLDNHKKLGTIEVGYMNEDKRLGTLVRTNNGKSSFLQKSLDCETSRIMKPDEYAHISYIADTLKYEDYLSLSFIDMLNLSSYTHKDKGFFGGKGNSEKARELADIIALRKSNQDVNLCLFHMKVEPFEQKNSGRIKSSFSYYTQVIGQSLEKAKAFLYEKDIQGIIDGIEPYFYEGESVAGNYIIFENIKELLLEAGKNINVCIYFPVRYEDYFGDTNSVSNLRRLTLEINWKRLRMLNDIFQSNVSNLSFPGGVNINLQLGLVVFCIEEAEAEKGIKNGVYLVDNVSELM